MRNVMMLVRSHYCVLALLIIAALVCYLIGYRKGSVIALIFGAGFEIAMWLRLARAQHRDADRR